MRNAVAADSPPQLELFDREFFFKYSPENLFQIQAAACEPLFVFTVGNADAAIAPLGVEEECCALIHFFTLIGYCVRRRSDPG
jgi:hypothetical protein